ncbi:uncharacterized protein [Physcomitrium patens]|uniref:uncharacterized protein isoform X3 n=1 Tax=Physcomitrium patens TaxID=3218 RepID=UPI000D168CD5|nr:E3 ubiquitin-protein ligase PRT6-like isoform X3 [Physcomitrium patens]|eukprot:XP_024367119.1 E3 ubiquitin-protein ligase PRT6-like isoform X3 [Physcomitrella patens]
MCSVSLSLWSQCFSPEKAQERLRVYEKRMCPPNLSFSQYLEALQSTGQAQCTTVWTKKTVAYRCRTCQVNDSSAICMGCFTRGQHVNHDYVMYHSESGGCCDCGYPEAWKPSGFCSAHRIGNRPESSVPADLERVSRLSVSSVLVMFSFIVSYIPETKGGPPVSTEKKIEVATIYLNWLKRLCSVDALRKIVCSEIVQRNAKDKEMREQVKTPLQILMKTFASMPEDIMEGETTLFLQMLYDPKFKQQYSEELMDHYQMMLESVTEKIVRNDDPLVRHFKALDSSLDRVMVQLFNVPNLELIESKNLLRLFVMVLGKILKRCLARGTNVVNLRDPKIENKVYLRPQGDLRLVFAHQCVTQHLFEKQPDVFVSILDILVPLQWMNPYHPAKYVDFEENTEWTLGIQLEMHIMAIIFLLISGCYSIRRPDLEDPTETSRKTLLSAANCTLKRLREYLNEESTLKFLSSTAHSAPVSLHVPLHRTLSVVLAKLVLFPWKDVNDGFLSSLNLNYSEQEVLALMEHPLRIVVWTAQIRANRWTDVSGELNRLELIYRGSFWHDQSMDMDILLLQFCTVARENMERAAFMRMAERFELKELVSTPLNENEGEKFLLVHDFIKLVLLVVRERRNTGLEEMDCLRYDVIQWLCVKNQTYSQLCRALTATPVDDKKLREILDKVAYFHSPRIQEQGYFELKAECWQEFDPLFAHFYLNELEDAQERAVHIGKLPHYWRIRSLRGVKPPYNRLINLLHTEECHQLLWNVLNYVSALLMNVSTSTAGESLGVVALQMLGLALLDRRDNPEKFPVPAETLQSHPASSIDIFYNVYRRPQFNQNTRVMEWKICQSESPCILDLLRKLQDVTNAPRLVDSAHFVTQLLTASPYFVMGGVLPTKVALLPKAHDRVDTAHDDERLQKKQRQEAIMAQFKAKQNAFLEQFEVSDEDENDGPSFSDNNLESGSSSEDPSTEYSSIGTKSGKAAVKSSEIYECAFCRTECGGSDKSTGWIAFVQRYNMPKHVIEKRKEVNSKAHAEAIVQMANVSEYGNSSNGSDVKQLVVFMEENMIDQIPAEHVRCCGHQMHQECFQSYHASLVKSHCSEITYEGKDIIDLPKTEFLCPICRRLANVLLPIVHQPSLSKMLQFCVNDDLENQREHWVKFWDKCNNLRGALDHFAIQSLNVRYNFLKEVESKDLPKSPVFWEVFASNITHCEVETREKLPEVASSSAAMNQPSDQRLWGGDAGHWIAIRELGKLAMVFNTLDNGQEMTTKRETIKNMLTKISQFLQNEEISSQNEYLRILFTSVRSVLIRHLNIMEETLDPEELENCRRKEEFCQSNGTVEALHRPCTNGCTSLSMHRDSPHGQQRHPMRWTRSEPPRPEFFRRRGMDEGVAPCDDMETKGEDYVTTRIKGISCRMPPDPEYLDEPVLVPMDLDRSSFLQIGSLFNADPFRLLVVILSAFPGWPKAEEILLLVKFSYVVTLIQVLLACSGLEGNASINVLDLEKEWGGVVQHTCLPFLRRAALLVQITVGADCKQNYAGLGRSVMDASYLQRELGLAECHKMFFTSISEVDNFAATSGETSLLQQLRFDHNLLNKDSKLILMEVPKDLHFTTLPSVYQDLMLRSINEKCKECDSVPLNPAICLVCGVFFCFASECCTKENMEECSRHAESEGCGIGIFLFMHSTQLVLIRGGRVCMAHSIYLDQYGEEDMLLRRCQLLHLSKLRLNEVRRLWLTAGFDSDTLILHNSRHSSRVL